MNLLKKSLALFVVMVVAFFFALQTLKKNSHPNDKKGAETEENQNMTLLHNRPPLEQKPEPDIGEIPIASKLPVLLVGTLVHSDPKQSIAALYFKSSKQTDIFVNKSTVAQTIQLEKIDRGLIYFKNLKTTKYEFLKLNDDELKSSMSDIEASRDVQKNGKNSFAMKRTHLEKYMNDLSKTLLTASVIPHKNSLGEIDGFQFVDLLPMGVFAQLGFQKGDIIKTVDGETVDSLQKAIETYNKLKNSSGFKIGIDRGGTNETFDYLISK